MEAMEGVVEHFGGFGAVWRFGGGLEVMQGQVWEPGLCLGLHTMIHQHIQAPHLLLPGQFQPPAWPRSSVFPAGMSRTGACWGQCSAESVERKSSVTENPPGDPTGPLIPKLLVEPWGQSSPTDGLFPLLPVFNPLKEVPAFAMSPQDCCPL